MDPNNAPNPDGWFDFTRWRGHHGWYHSRAQTGRIYFTTLEPFGSYLDQQLVGVPPEIEALILYQQLYDSTKTAAQNIPELNASS